MNQQQKSVFHPPRLKTKEKTPSFESSSDRIFTGQPLCRTEHEKHSFEKIRSPYESRFFKHILEEWKRWQIQVTLTDNKTKDKNLFSLWNVTKSCSWCGVNQDYARAKLIMHNDNIVSQHFEKVCPRLGLEIHRSDGNICIDPNVKRNSGALIYVPDT